MSLNKFKVVFSLVVSILIFNLNSLTAQRTNPEKGDNVILIVGDTIPENNYTNFGKFIVEQGFSFFSNNKEFLSLTTNERTSKGGYKYTLTISFSDSLIVVRPRCNYLLFGSSIVNYNLEWSDWSYAKAKNSAFGVAYSAFEPILKKYNGQLYFIKK
jgi:hypothetical protein